MELPDSVYRAIQEMTAILKPLYIERLIEAQENPATRFVEVVGGEPIIDFDRLWAILFGSEIQA